jgi:hypothetical protein
MRSISRDLVLKLSGTALVRESSSSPRKKGTGVLFRATRNNGRSYPRMKLLHGGYRNSEGKTVNGGHASQWAVSVRSHRHVSGHNRTVLE